MEAQRHRRGRDRTGGPLPARGRAHARRPQAQQPGRHLDPGESPADGCARETLEETAHSFTPTALVGIYLSRFQRPGAGEDITYLRFAFCGEVGPVQSGRALDHGIERAVWMTADEIRASAHRHRSPLLLRCLEDYLAGRRYPLEAVFTDPSVTAPRVAR